MKLHIKNGRLVDPANNIDAVTELFIADGKVAAVDEIFAAWDSDENDALSLDEFTAGLATLKIR